MTPTFNVPQHPGSSGEAVSRRMSGLRRQGNEREVRLRQLLHRDGLRFRVGLPVPGLRRRTIDIAFTRWRLAVFLDGCFWHGCPLHGTSPRSNSDWWQQKITANKARDRDTDRHLADVDWCSLRIWEHESFEEARARVHDALTRRQLGENLHHGADPQSD